MRAASVTAQGVRRKRFKIQMVLRDVLRTPSTGVVEVDEAKGLVEIRQTRRCYRLPHPHDKPGHDAARDGRIVGQCAQRGDLFPPSRAPAGTTSRWSRSCARPVSPLARLPTYSKHRQPSIPLTQHLMEECDLTLATGGKPMVKAAYSSGRPAYGVGAGNSSIVIDETADIDIAAQNTRISKTSDFGSGCSADGNIIIQESIYDAMVAALEAEGGYLFA